MSFETPLQSYLPSYVLLNGNEGSGKSTLAGLLADELLDVIQRSFAAPIRAALTVTFYPDARVAPDLTQQDVKRSPLPFSSSSHRDYMNDYGVFLKAVTGRIDIFAQLAKQQADRDLSACFRTVVFDDLRFIEELKAFPPDRTLLLHVTRPGADTLTKGSILSHPAYRTILFRNESKPEHILPHLLETLTAHERTS